MGACSERQRKLAVQYSRYPSIQTQTEFIRQSQKLPASSPTLQQPSSYQWPPSSPALNQPPSLKQIKSSPQLQSPPIFHIVKDEQKPQQDEAKLTAAREMHQSTIGLLTWFDKFAVKHFGSGVLISKNILLTLASNIYNRQYKQQNWGFDFHLGANEQKGVVYQVEKWIYNKDYVKNCDDEKAQFQYNYAIIKLKNNKRHHNRSKKFMTLQVPDHICLKCTRRIQAQLYRFAPRIKGIFPSYHKNALQMPAERGFITQIAPNQFKIRYNIYVTEQDKGCPVVLDSKMIAIHTKQSTQGGEGRFITQDMLDDIQSFRKKFEDSDADDSSQQDIDRKIDEQKVKEQLRDHLQQFLKKQEEELNDHIPKFIKNDSDISTKLQTIDLSSKDSNKLTPQSVKVFAQFNLDNLNELKLGNYDLIKYNNRIADQGLQILCKNDYPSLKVIQIDDNNVSINGIRHLIFNKWSDEVEYKLYSVSSNDDGYYLKVGEEIPLIKSLIKDKDLSQNKLTTNLTEKTVLNATKLLLDMPIDDEDPKQIALQSQELEDKYKKADTEQPSLPSVLLLLKKSVGDNLSFRKQGGLKSNISSKVIFSGSANQRVSFEIDLKDFKDLHAQKLQKSSKKLKQLEKSFFDRIKQFFGVDTSDLTLDKVLNNPVRAEASDSATQALGKNLVAYQTMKVKFKQHFEKFQLSEQEFDSTGDFQFPSPSQASIQERGGFPYYQPVIGKRFGIKVKNVFKDGNWLLMNNNKGEYAIGFHGINNPLKTTALQSIMKGREKGEMLRAGLGQAYSHGDCINKNEKVGNGIYFSPYFLTGLLEYSHISQEYEDVRPYGIVFTRDQIAELKKIPKSSSVSLHRQIYKDQFNKETWDKTYKAKFMSFKNK